MTALHDHSETAETGLSRQGAQRRRLCGLAALWGCLTRSRLAAGGLGSTVVTAAATAAEVTVAATSAPALLLARDWPAGRSPAGFLVAEKFDGVRAFWDGRQLRTRSGQVLAAPAWFLARLPAEQPLDGELWLGRGRFDETSALLRRLQAQDADWRELRYLLFELPGAPGTFTERLEGLRALVQRSAWDQLQLVEQQRIEDAPALQARLDEVIRARGEGLMLHRADAAYVTGRAEVLFKLKPQQDAEALVIGYTPGRGRHAGRVGALRVRDETGREFLLGSGLSDAQRESPPPIGSWVTYTHRGETRRGLPRFATFWRQRDEP